MSGFESAPIGIPTSSAVPLFVVDVGNTRTKLGVYFDSNAAFPDVAFADAEETFEAAVVWLDSLPISKRVAARWIVSSVARRKTQALEAAVRRVRPNDLFVVLTLRDVPIAVEYDFPEKLGIDRAVAGFAGTRFLGVGRPFLAVDVGTAATIDYVDARGVFRGGAILPGPRLTAEALHAKTASLPTIDDPENEGDARLKYPATETQNAIRLGVVFSLVGAIAAFYWKTKRNIAESGDDSNRLALLIAGGDAQATERNLRTLFEDCVASRTDVGACPEIFVEPRLVAFGLNEMAREKSDDFWRRGRFSSERDAEFA